MTVQELEDQLKLLKDKEREIRVITDSGYYKLSGIVFSSIEGDDVYLLDTKD